MPKQLEVKDRLNRVTEHLIEERCTKERNYEVIWTSKMLD